jgi:hypothetical protein
MSPMRARYVTVCQQLLALGVVVMALVPATRVVSLDVVGVGPGEGVAQPTIAVAPEAAMPGAAGMSGYAQRQHRCAAGLHLRGAERMGAKAMQGKGCREKGRLTASKTPAGAG